MPPRGRLRSFLTGAVFLEGCGPVFPQIVWRIPVSRPDMNHTSATIFSADRIMSNYCLPAPAIRTVR